MAGLTLHQGAVKQEFVEHPLEVARRALIEAAVLERADGRGGIASSLRNCAHSLPKRSPVLAVRFSIDHQMLDALPSNGSSERWPTAADIAEQVGLTPDDARDFLAKLCSSGLCEQHGETLSAYARTASGDRAIEEV